MGLIQIAGENVVDVLVMHHSLINPVSTCPNMALRYDELLADLSVALHILICSLEFADLRGNVVVSYEYKAVLVHVFLIDVNGVACFVV